MEVIKINDVSMKYILRKNKYDYLKDRILLKKTHEAEEFWALKNVSFTVKKGEFLAIIGRNGSGKSTLLSIISNVIKPTNGSVEVDGHISSLLELGAGFFPDFTGRENIYFYASIHGRKKKEIDKKIDEIIEFSELQDFIDYPVRTYSSGMSSRLAFSIAINIEPDILIVDEVLAVGDAAFKKKCIERIYSIRESGATIVMVTHSLEMIKDITDRAIWMDKGRIMQTGSLKEIETMYREYMQSKKKRRV